MILTREQWALVRQQLAERKHSKLLLKTDQPAAYDDEDLWVCGAPTLCGGGGHVSTN